MSLYIYKDIDYYLIIKTVLILMYAIHIYLFLNRMILSERRLFEDK
jgi:hypothetical protein